jgi:hypothetical protein
MFRLFQSIFETGAAEQGRYPETLVKAAIERAIDGTDPRLRALPGCARKMRAAVIRAIDHVVNLVEQLPAPIEVSRNCYGDDRRLAVFFPSVERMQQVMSTGGVLGDFVQHGGGIATDRVIALLLMDKQERNVLGVEQQGDIVVHEVPQVTVGFANHRLLDPADAEDETRRLLKRRAYDHLLGIALGRIESAGKQRTGLEQQCKLLGRKLRALETGGWSFKATGKASDLPALEAQLEEIQQQLRDLGSDTGTLRFHLDTLNDVLGRAEEQLWATRTTLIVDRKGIKREQPSDTAAEVALDELHSATGQTAIMVLVSVPRGEIGTRGDLLKEAQRYLG